MSKVLEPILRPIYVDGCREREKNKACRAIDHKVEKKPIGTEDKKKTLKGRSGRTWGETLPARGNMAERKHLNLRVS